MKIERMQGGACRHPFPIHDDLVATLLAAHATRDDGRNACVAHVLGACAGFSYADGATMTEIAERLGLDHCGCVAITQVVDAMLIYSTAYLIQSRCGRVVILSYRGTEPTNLGNWLGDADVGAESIRLDDDLVTVHSGFYRNVLATRDAVLRELSLALDGRSLADPEARTESPLVALYVTGHSLGGAMAVLFSLGLAGTVALQPVAERLRAVYTFGQPLTVGDPLPRVAYDVGRALYRHVIARDIVPTLPPAPWGRLAHFGQEYRHESGEWRKSAAPVMQAQNLRHIPASLLSFLATAKRRNSTRYSMAVHGPHHYIAALRPKGRVTEFGTPG